MKKILLAVVITLLLAGSAFAQGSAATIGCTNGSLTLQQMNESNPKLDVIQAVLTSDAGGEVDGCAFPINGKYIHKIVVFPSASAAPTTLYDCQIQDELGVDLMQGNLQNLPATLASDGSDGSYSPNISGSIMASEAYGDAAFVCDNMGDSKITTMDIYLYIDK